MLLVVCIYFIVSVCQRSFYQLFMFVIFYCYTMVIYFHHKTLAVTILMLVHFFFVYDHLSHHYYDVYVIRNVTSRCCCCCGCGCRNQSINHLLFSRRIVDFLRRISFCSVSGRSCAGSCTPQCQRELPTLVCAI